MKYLYFLLIILTLIGCQSKSKTDLQTKLNDSDTTARIETKVYGDSLKIIYEYRGDTIIQNRIDLKGTSDDGFDNSFTVKSIFSTRMAAELNCTKELKLNQDGVDFIFCLNDAIEKIEKDIIKFSDKHWRVESLNEIKNDLTAIKKGETDSLSMRTYYLTFNFLRDIDFSIYDNDKKVKVEKVRIERYETNFSGGRNYYLIDRKNDTIAQFNVNEWMR